MNKTICELFAGVGGFRLAFESVEKDWETVWFSQWEPSTKKQNAHECYVKHFGDCLDNNSNYNTNKDIALIDKQIIPDHTLLTAGFPCQDFSVAKSNAEGIEGKKGVLWWQIYETLKVKRPPFCLFENVDRLLKSPSKQKGRDFGIILASLNNLGYSVEWRVVNSADYGSPQKRNRLYIFASLYSTIYARLLVFDNNREDIIKHYGLMARAFHVESAEAPQTFDIYPMDCMNSMPPFNFQNAGYVSENGFGITMKVNPKKTECKRSISRIMQTDVPEKYFIKEDAIEKWKYLKGAKKIQRTSSSGYKYTYSEGAIAFPDSIDEPSRTILTGEATTNRSSHVIEDIKTNKLRTLTPIEVERLQGFPDNWTNTGMSERMRYFCMGNAVNVLTVKRIAKVINAVIDFENRYSD